MHLLTFAVLNSLGHFNLGYTLIYISGCLTQTLGIFEIPLEQQSYTSGQIISIVPLGAMIGSVLSGILSKYYTKRDNFIYVDLANILATVLIFSNNLSVFLLARFVQGVCIGLSSVQTVRYLLDSIKSQDSGFIFTIVSLQIQYNTNFIPRIAFTMGLGLSIFMPITFDPLNTFYLFIYVIPLVASCARLLANTLVYRYETPVEHLKKGQTELAYQALLTIYGNKNDAYIALQEKKELLANQEKDTKSKSIYLYTGIMMIIIHQFSGINAINFYVSVIFQKVVPDVFTSRILSFIFVLLGPIATTFTPQLVNKSGNKQTMINGGNFLVPILIIMSLSSYADSIPQSNVYVGTIISFVIIFSVSAYNFVFNATLGPCAWNICGQTLSDSQMAILSFTNWSSTAVVSFIFPILVDMVGVSVCFIIFGISLFIGIILIQKFIEDDSPKTKLA